MSHKNINEIPVFINNPGFSVQSGYPEQLTETERRVWEELTKEWKTSRDVRAALPDLSFNTINNMLGRLERRGMIEGRKNTKEKVKEWRRVN